MFSVDGGREFHQNSYSIIWDIGLKFGKLLWKMGELAALYIKCNNTVLHLKLKSHHEKTVLPHCALKTTKKLHLEMKTPFCHTLRMSPTTYSITGQQKNSIIVNTNMKQYRYCVCKSCAIWETTKTTGLSLFSSRYWKTVTDKWAYKIYWQHFAKC